MAQTAKQPGAALELHLAPEEVELLRSIEHDHAAIADTLSEASKSWQSGRSGNYLPYFAAGSSILSVIVAGSGYWVVHFFSVRRQRRDEFFKLIQDLGVLLDQIADAAAKAWLVPGNHPDAQAAAAELPAKLHRLGLRLEAMRRRHPKFGMRERRIQFRIAATRDLEEAGRAADPARAAFVRDTAVVLASEMDLAYLNIYG